MSLNPAMSKALVIILLFFLCAAFAPADGTRVSYDGNKVLVGGKLYCFYDETKKGSNSFNISTPDGEVVIIADVKVEHQLREGRIHNYFNVRFIPSGKELNVKHSREFPKDFVRSLVKHDVMQSGIWNEYGATLLFNDWSLNSNAIIEPSKSEVIYNENLSKKIAKNIRLDSGSRIYINDSLAYTYRFINNWMRNYKYWKGNEGTFYYVYSTDSILQAEIRIADHRSKTSKNVRMIMMPEQKMYYFSNVDAKSETAVLTTAVKMLLLQK